MSSEVLKRLRDAGALSDLDVHFALFMGRLAQSENLELLLAAALVSSHTREGHTCLELTRMAGTEPAGREEGGGTVVCPPEPQWQESL